MKHNLHEKQATQKQFFTVFLIAKIKITKNTLKSTLPSNSQIFFGRKNEQNEDMVQSI